jgi:hypothetical protein
MPPETCAGNKDRLFRFAEADTFTENREIKRFDAGEQRIVCMHQKPKRGAAVCIDQIEKLGAFFVHLPGAVGFEAEKFTDAESGFVFCEVLR